MTNDSPGINDDPAAVHRRIAAAGLDKPKSNNPPYFELPLTKDDFEFMVKEFEANIEFALMVMGLTKDRTSLQLLVDRTEKSKSILMKLRKK